MEKTKLGIIGCGVISGAYLSALKLFRGVEVSACSDLDLERARARAKEFQVPRACSVKELLADPEIRIVINLTIPKAHGEVGLQVLEAGKCVHNEKPLAVTREEGRRLLETARARTLRVGSAPDTFLGGGIQTCRRMLDEGAIGQPVAASAFMTSHGHESWHPDPGFYYQAGGGPVFDMGPYYLTALVFLLGPIRRVTGSARITFPERTITSEPKKGQTIRVDVPTHVAGVLDFACGAIGTMVMSFDVWRAQLPRIEIYGSEGSLSVPDPNGFGGKPALFRHDQADKGWQELPFTHGYGRPCRGIGVVDLAAALRENRPHRASGELAYHVLDTMHAIHDAAREGRHVTVASTCEAPAPLPMGCLD